MNEISKPPVPGIGLTAKYPEVGTGPIDTGTYPNLNVAPKVATRQFTPEEAQAKHAALQAAQRRQSPGGRALTTEERRRLQLVEDQGDTLEIIEGRSAR